jgi:hypothetical protein
VFKILRAKGIIQLLKDSVIVTYDKEMSVAEVKYKDIKQVHPTLPQWNIKNQDYDINKLTLDNLKALKAKSYRFYKASVAANDFNRAEVEYGEYQYYDAEIKRRLKYINAPIEEADSMIDSKELYVGYLKPENFEVGGERFDVIKDKMPQASGHDYFNKRIARPRWGSDTLAWRFRKDTGMLYWWDKIPAKPYTDEVVRWIEKNIHSHVKDNASIHSDSPSFLQSHGYLDEGYGAGIPEEDPLHNPGERWRIKWGSRKTPKIDNDIKEVINKLVNETIEKLKREQLSESMYVYIKDAGMGDKLNTLDGLSNHFLKQVISPIVTSLPPDRKAYFDKNSIGYYDLISPDGDYYQGPERGTGIINFYISGFMTDTIQLILKNIIHECQKLGISVGQITNPEQSGVNKSQVVRIPVVKNTATYAGPPEMNLSNRNAYHIFKNILQFEPDDESGSSFHMKTQDLIDSIESITGDKGWIKQHEVPTKTNKPKPPVEPGDEWKTEEEPESDNPHDATLNQIGQELGATMYSMGLDDADIQRRLKGILHVAEWAKEHGYPEMYVA